MNRDNPTKTRLFYAAIVVSSLLSVSIALLYRQVIPSIPFIVLTAFIIGFATKEKLLFTGITLLQSFFMGMALQDILWSVRCMVFFMIYMVFGMCAGVLINKAKNYHDGAWALHQKKYPLRIFVCILVALILLVGGSYSYYLYFSVL